MTSNGSPAQSPALDSPVFICGIGRSGTTLCGEILNVHSQFAIAEETWFLDRVVFTLKRFGFPDALRADVEKTVSRVVYEAYASSRGKRRFGDKVFGDVDVIDRIFDRTPRYLWMVRHPVDVAESWAERFSLAETAHILAGWAPPAASLPADAAARQRSIVLHVAMRSAQYLHTLLGRGELTGRILVCRYEDLAGNPAHTCGRICEFLGAEYEEQMLDGAKIGARGVVRGDQTKFRSVIDDRSVARWTRLTDAQRGVYGPLGGDVRAALGALAQVGVTYEWSEDDGVSRDRPVT
jgi:hypothetical protein